MKRHLTLFAAFVLLVSAAAPAAPAVAAAPAALPTDSVYQLPVLLQDQDGQSQALGARRGRPQLVTMFYTSCQMICPMIIDTLKMTRAAVAEPARDGFDILAVSFDPARDDVATLRNYVGLRKLDLRHWTLAHTTPASTRPLAALLGVQYRQLPDGEFNHTSELILLDAEGRIVARTDVIGRVDPEFVAAVTRIASSMAVR